MSTQAFLSSGQSSPLYGESLRLSPAAKHTELMKAAGRGSKGISLGTNSTWNRNSPGTLTVQAVGRSLLKNRFKPSVGSVGT